MEEIFLFKIPILWPPIYSKSHWLMIRRRNCKPFKLEHLLLFFGNLSIMPFLASFFFFRIIAMISQIFKRSLVDFAFVCLFTKIAFHVWLLPANHFRVGVFFSLVQNDKRILGIYLLECVRRWIDGINEKSQIPLENEPAKTWHNFCMWYWYRLWRSSQFFHNRWLFFCFFHRFFFRLFSSIFLNQFNKTRCGYESSANAGIVTRSWAFFLPVSFFLSLSRSYVGIRAFCYSMPILIFIWDLSRLNNANAHSVVHNRIDVWMFFFLIL